MCTVLFLTLFFMVPFCFANSELQSNAPIINLETLKHYTLYSYAASCRVGLTNWTCYWCKNRMANLPPIRVISVFASNGFYGTYGYIGLTNDNRVLLSFRGSESTDNWIHDFEFEKVQYPAAPTGAEVHYGFYSSYLAVQLAIQKTVRGLLNANPTLSVTVTGHSLGAALSIFCAADLINANIIPASKVNIINFGQPRVGNKNFARYFNTFNVPVARVTNQDDIVPHVPLKVLGFYHERTEYWFPNNVTSFVQCDASGEDPSCSDSRFDLSIFDHVTYLGFHSMDGSAYGCGHVDGKSGIKSKRSIHQ